MGQRMTLDDQDDAEMLAKAFFQLDGYGYINTYEQEEDAQCDHWRGIAQFYAKRIIDKARQLRVDTTKPTPYVDESAYIGLNIDNRNNGL